MGGRRNWKEGRGEGRAGGGEGPGGAEPGQREGRGGIGRGGGPESSPRPAALFPACREVSAALTRPSDPRSCSQK